jgi:uncharacterized integral membrane protein
MTLAFIQNIGVVEWVLILIVLPALVLGGIYVVTKLIARAVLTEKRRSERRPRETEGAASRP